MQTIYSYMVKKMGSNLGMKLIIKAIGVTWFISKSPVSADEKTKFGLWEEVQIVLE